MAWALQVLRRSPGTGDMRFRQHVYLHSIEDMTSIARHLKRNRNAPLCLGECMGDVFASVTFGGFEGQPGKYHNLATSLNIQIALVEQLSYY
jgi:hypothetical protein